jgi:N-acetylglucosaminyldiphosphoundecaprenol N-acetyl-beta-D-mannosaminyltransferase
MPTEHTPAPLPTTILGLAAACDVGDVDDAARAIVGRATSGDGGYVCLCNVHVLTTALHDRALRIALAAAWKRLPDGAPVAWLQRRLGSGAARRVGGPDLTPRVVDLGRAAGLRHFLLGSTPHVLAGMRHALESRYPGAELVGSHSPPFAPGPDVDVETLEEIRAVSPHVLWCALGAPKQELWMHRVSPELPGVLLVGVGAAFDFLAGEKARAPEWMRDHGLEWLHRLGSEPARLGRRYFRTNTEFLVRSGLELSRRHLPS